MSKKELSIREKEIISLMQRGFKNKNIASILYLKEKTVSTYIKRIKEKLGLDSDSNSYITVKTYLKTLYDF
jgi:DNA-binding NarL/FixJ family response regulator